LNTDNQEPVEFLPLLRPRRSGGWLEIEPKSSKTAVGATANTLEDALANYRLANTEWIRVPKKSGPDVPTDA
jgi:hypothetical protein